MLRIGYLASDFNPMMLMLGEAEDFRALAGMLRQFARNPDDVRLDRLGFCRVGGAPVTVTRHGTVAGIVPLDGGGYCWRVDPDAAAGFADQVERLADPALAAGSEILECVGEEAIPVKVSRGEFTDDFLLAG